MVEARLRPARPVLAEADDLDAPSGERALPEGRWAEARQRPDGSRRPARVLRRARVEDARFMLALDDDTTEFHRRFARDPLLGPSVRALRGLRPLRKATVDARDASARSAAS